MIAILIIGLLASALAGVTIEAEAERARQLLMAGRAEEAVPIYRHLATVYPDNASIQLNLSIADFKAGLYRETIEATRAVLRIEPDNAAANLFLGASYLKLENPAERFSLFRKRPTWRRMTGMLA